MGAGKTSVGRELARRLGWRFVDLDDRVILQTGLSVADVFARDGEAVFRRLESEQLKRLLQEVPQTPSVIALGGGAWVQEENATALRSTGLPVISLDAPADELWSRCAAEGPTRPLRRSEDEFRRLYEARRGRYLEGTTAVNTTGKNVAEVAESILLLLRLAGS